MTRVKCLFIPKDESSPVRGMEIEPYKGAHEIFNAVINSPNGTVTKADGKRGTLIWMDDSDDARKDGLNPRATALAGQEIAGHAVVFQIGLDGEMTDVDYEALGFNP